MKRKNNSSKLIKISVALICAVICVVLCLLERNNRETYDTSQDFVKVFDVGQAECILIYSNGYSMLLDTGLSETANEVCIGLEQLNISDLDVLMISHLHDDHIGGIAGITENFSVKNLILPEISIESEGLILAEAAINKVVKAGGNVYSAVQGMNFNIGDFEITVLACFNNESNENNRSIFLSCEIDGKRFLFTGDAEQKAEKLLLKENLDLKSDVLKVAHHGSNSSSHEEFLKAVSPEISVISVGDNSYGHPHNEILARLERINTKLYRTDKSGDVTFNIKDGYISVKTEK